MTGPAQGAVLVLGARSDMGVAIAHRFARAGHPLWLAGRDVEAMAADAADIGLRHGVDTRTLAFDALDVAGHAAFVAALPAVPAVVVCCVGLLGDQAESQRDAAAASLVLRSNFEGPALALEALAEPMAAAGGGSIVGIGSVAGERGRASNYVYGAAKAGFAAYLSGLRNRLAGRGVQVLTVLPGYVATRMTAGMTLPPALTAQPAEVGEAVYRAVIAGRDVIHVRPVWGLIMAIIRALPETLFKRLKL